MAEVHEGDGKQDELSHGGWQICPCHAQGVPLQYVHGAENYQRYDYREEPFGIHDALGNIPITSDYITKEEERHVLHQLYQGCVVEQGGWFLQPVSIRPPAKFGQVACLVYRQGEEEENGYRYP